MPLNEEAPKKFRGMNLSFWALAFGPAAASLCLTSMPAISRGMCADVRVPRALWMAAASVQFGGGLPLLVALGWKLVGNLWRTLWLPLLPLLLFALILLVLGLTFVQASTTDPCPFVSVGGAMQHGPKQPVFTLC